MSELKTLKDLEKAMHVGDVREHLFDEKNKVGANWMTSVCLAGDLKAEAIKWIKLNKGEISVADWVEFFNIEEEFANLVFKETEEDLK